MSPVPWRIRMGFDGHSIEGKAGRVDSKAAEQDGRRLRGFTTRAKALEVAAELFASQGYSATSISSIAQAAGLHAASLYHAFGSKEGLLAAVVQHASDEFYGYLEAMGDQLSPSAAISRILVQA